MLAARTHHGASAVAAAAYPHFETRIFTRGSSTLFNPDGIVVTKHYVFVAYQNASDTNPTPSTVVKYNRQGVVLGAVTINGRCNGIRLNPYTQKLWALVNNDGLNGTPPRQPALDVIEPNTLQTMQYHFGKAQPHGGGYDDLAFIGGRAFLSASSPTLTPAGVNDKPIAVEVRLEGGEADIKPILYGNGYGLNLVSGKTERLNVTDPDSFAVDAQNDLIIVSEGDAQLIVVRNPGGPDQKVARLPVGMQLDDVVATKGTHGTLFVADSTLNVVYTVTATFPRGTDFAAGPLGAPVQSFIGSLDPTTGYLTPLLTVRDGVVDPASLIFVAPGS
ncbi:MAG: hypothetical protein GIX03_05410 [Candidatus Eremiobacteraeota bacterium]|nr:hypothetical protein [Candidatus Eremiobacteraeota bacterium]MBC5802436.1 hypothetical protein [Candidatus Eremiobacteraeota bacterium]MBC5822889.1 hypothetical protein [Candidatus Eremiobacteraeota bacterium]